jgi:hypothetical protein
VLEKVRINSATKKKEKLDISKLILEKNKLEYFG